jgi:hypothetical protein
LRTDHIPVPSPPTSTEIDTIVWDFLLIADPVPRSSRYGSHAAASSLSKISAAAEEDSASWTALQTSELPKYSTTVLDLVVRVRCKLYVLVLYLRAKFRTSELRNFRTSELRNLCGCCLVLGLAAEVRVLAPADLARPVWRALRTSSPLRVLSPRKQPPPAGKVLGGRAAIVRSGAATTPRLRVAAAHERHPLPAAGAASGGLTPAAAEVAPPLQHRLAARRQLRGLRRHRGRGGGDDAAGAGVAAAAAECRSLVTLKKCRPDRPKSAGFRISDRSQPSRGG